MIHLREIDWRAVPGFVGAAISSRLLVPRASREDLWLERWAPLMRSKARSYPILEIGCGTGRDTRALVEQGFQVTALDVSGSAITRARRRAPSATFVCQDVRERLPVDRTGVAVASMSLHYFEWEETIEIVKKIHAALLPGGILLCRLNSTSDTYFGASGHTAIQDGLYRVHGQVKRFFDEATVRTLFSGWNMVSIRERTIHRYLAPKSVWEVVTEKKEHAEPRK